MSERRIVVASADRLFAEASAAYVEASGRWKVVALPRDGLEALAHVQRHRPDVVLVLGDLERLGAKALARQVRRRWATIGVVVVADVEDIEGALLPPNSKAEALMEALDSPRDGSAEGPQAGSDLERLQSLTGRERHILKLIGGGRTMKDIAGVLGTSVHTVRTHMQNLYRKLGCHNRLEVVRFAAKHGLTETPPGEGR